MFNSKQRQWLVNSGGPKETQEFITLGHVVNTNDPQQMGRVQAVCQAWGDTFEMISEDLPWCTYVTPFGGQVTAGTRGPGLDETGGGVAYGMWAIPKVNAQILVACLDGDPSIRVYMGCVYDQFVPHTMPHGRWTYEDYPEPFVEKDAMTAFPFGPYSSEEKFIKPLNENIKQAFAYKSEPNYEWRNRAADYTVARFEMDDLEAVIGDIADDKDVVHDGWTSTQGYGVSRSDPDGPTTITDKNYDSPVYSFTTPGTHGLSMDDRMENCRMRLRTASGHQIIMDDTNERIYIQTAKGNNWIELDEDGNIDIFTSNKVNVRAAKDINFTSDETIRFTAKKGIHMYTEDEIRMQSLKDIHVRTDQNIRAHAAQSAFLQADQDIQLTAGQSYYLKAAQEINELCGSDMKLSTGSNFQLNAGANIIETGSRIDLNGPQAAVATDAQPPAEEPAFWTSRVPDHEPWARVMTKNDFTHEPEFPYTSEQVNRSERGHTFDRGRYWRR